MTGAAQWLWLWLMLSLYSSFNDRWLLAVGFNDRLLASFL
jgi:hypothetical protein